MGSLWSICARRPQYPQKAMGSQLLSCSASDISFSKAATDEPILTIVPASLTVRAIEAATLVLKSKRPVVIPTETVYGLAANARDPEAVSRIFSAKGRPSDNPLIVHVASRMMLQSLLPESYLIPTPYEKLIRAFWPGPLTLLFPSESAKIPAIVTAGLSTVAIRMPSHPVALAVIAHSAMPLAAPSANSSGRPSPTRAAHVWEDLGIAGKVDLILDGGPCEVGLESTVVDGISDPNGTIRVLRPGGVTVEEIRAVLCADLKDGERQPQVLVYRKDYQDVDLEQHPTTPGMKYLHYTPSVPVVLLIPSRGPKNECGDRLSYILGGLSHFKTKSLSNKRLKVGCMFAQDSPIHSQLPSIQDIEFVQYDLGLKAEPSIAATRLFDGLLTLEKAEVDFIIVEGMEEANEGLAIMNRLRKAATEVRFVETSPSGT